MKIVLFLSANCLEQSWSLEANNVSKIVKVAPLPTSSHI
jgi:hypothetical protein